jgi:MFS family permease
MKNREAPITLAVSFVMACRLLGLFMLLPVFSAYLTQIPSATPMLLGLAVGVYGFTQACLQIPFGLASDAWGRKKVIIFGLLIFLLGSLVASDSHSIITLIIGRAIQGAGAVGSALLALLADHTRDEHRSKAMAFMGMCIGASFSIAMIIGPWISAHFGLKGIFDATAILAILSLLIVIFFIPNQGSQTVDPTVSVNKQGFKAVFMDTQLLRLDASIFFQHAIFTAFFIAIPILLTHLFHVSASHQSLFYLVVMMIAFVMMVPFIILGESKRKLKPLFIGAIVVIGLVQGSMTLFHSAHLIVLMVLLTLFFMAFNFLEATLPSWVSKVAPLRAKGCAMGVYSTSQFLGIFVGGVLGGFALHHGDTQGIFLLTSGFAILWLLCLIQLKHPPYVNTLVFSLNTLSKPIQNPVALFKKITGVSDCTMVAHAQLLYIKYDKTQISEKALRNVLQTGSLLQDL